MTDAALTLQSPCVEPECVRDGAASAAPRLELDALFRAEADYVWNALRRLGIARDDLEDLTHDVFVTVQRRWDGYDPTRPIRPWLFGIAFRVAADHRKRARHGREVAADVAEHPDAAPAPDECVAAQQTRDLVCAALGELSLDQRAVFMLHELDGCAVPQIAEALGIALNTAYSRLRLARKHFAEAVRRAQSHRGDTDGP